MTFYEKICAIDDIVQLIFNCSSSIDTKTALPGTCKLLYDLLRSKAKFALNQDILRFELNPDNIQYIPKNDCVNIECDDMVACIGYCIVYDLKLNPDYRRECKEIIRYIPYCEKCTYKYVNFGHTIEKPKIYNEYNFFESLFSSIYIKH